MDSFFGGKLKSMKDKVASAAGKYIPKEGIKGVANAIKNKAQEIRAARAGVGAGHQEQVSFDESIESGDKVEAIPADALGGVQTEGEQ